MSNNTLNSVEKTACFGGWQHVYEHESQVLGCAMRFAIYIPEQAKTQRLPVLYWLSGLTCTEQNFITKAGYHRYAAENSVIVVAPDTSPRGDGIANDDAYDLGQGAGFYLNATQEPWAKNFKMYDYIVNELPELINRNFPANGKQSISGHSMGGHGALTIALKNPDKYVSASAFSPIVAPTQVPWGQKAFNAYLGSDQSTWAEYDTVELILSGKKFPEIFVDQGRADQFFAEQLQTEKLEQACEQMQIPAKIRYHDNYDHSYYFIASFIGEHIEYHAQKLANA